MPEQGIDILEAQDLAALPPDACALFRQKDPFSTLAWYRATAAHALPGGATPAFLVARLAHRAVAVLPMQRGPGKAFSSLVSLYASRWQPLLAEDAAENPACLRAIGRAIGCACKAVPVLRLDALDSSSVFLTPLAEGLRTAGFALLRFNHFGNWHQALPATWPAYLANRPANLRATIRRRGKRLVADLGARLSVVDSAENLEQGIADYETIYAASWKTAEPYGTFIAAFMREAASCGTLRLFLLHVNDMPVAAQIWIVADGSGHLLKLAHLESARALSPGTVLTALAIEHLMQRDHITSLDLGRGDDPYKQLWADERRQRVGILFANPRTITGAAAIAAHAAGALVRTARILKVFSFFSLENNRLFFF